MKPLETTIRSFLDKFEMFPDANTAVSHFPQAYGLLEQACEVLTAKEPTRDLTPLLRSPDNEPSKEERYENFIFINIYHEVFINPWYATEINKNIIGYVSLKEMVKEILK